MFVVKSACESVLWMFVGDQEKHWALRIGCLMCAVDFRATLMEIDTLCHLLYSRFGGDGQLLLIDWSHVQADALSNMRVWQQPRFRYRTVRSDICRTVTIGTV
jgi:hypothetical protein